jgi:benzylsuccinate CoA-transferase BbsF subunit
MGAEVIQIESLARPQLFRTISVRPHTAEWYKQSPKYKPIEGEWSLNQSVAFNIWNFNKKSCTLNLTQPEARELIKKLIEKCNGVVENFGYGTMDRMGLGYSTLKEIRKDLCMLSLTGFGQTGPKKHYAGYFSTLQAFCGMTHLTGYKGGAPVTIGPWWGDIVTGTYGAFAFLTALHHAMRTGEGQYIDVTLGETCASFIPEALMDYTMNKRIRGPMGNEDDVMAPHNCYRCKGKDEWVAIAVANDEEWRSLFRAIGKPSLAADERFSNGFNRWLNREALDKIIEEWTISHTAHEVMEMLQKAGVAAGPSYFGEMLLEDPQMKERDFFVEIDHPEVMPLRHARIPLRDESGPIGDYTHSPLLGQDNDYVFGILLGLSKEEIGRLVDQQVIY